MPGSAKKKFNQFTRSMLLAVTLLLLGMGLCGWHMLSCDTTHAPASVRLGSRLGPALHLAERDFDQIHVMPRQFGSLAVEIGGETELPDYDRSIRETFQLRRRLLSQLKPYPNSMLGHILAGKPFSFPQLRRHNARRSHGLDFPAKNG